MKIKTNMVYGIMIGFLFAMVIFKIEKDEQATEAKIDKYYQTPVKEKNIHKVRGYKANKKPYDHQNPINNYHTKSDQEIRNAREILSYKTGKYYIYTPDRKVESLDRKMEDYIMDNIDELHDQYGQ